LTADRYIGEQAAVVSGRSYCPEEQILLRDLEGFSEIPLRPDSSEPPLGPDFFFGLFLGIVIGALAGIFGNVLTVN
jgi:hypothetical protein